MDHIPLIGVEGLELADGHAVLAGDPVVGIARLRRISLFHDRLRSQMGPGIASALIVEVSGYSPSTTLTSCKNCA